MNVTFLFGNGFDLNIGMKTAYTDIYPLYFNEQSRDGYIEGFKNLLKKDSPKYKTWADFEMGLAKNAGNFLSQADIVSCVRDFRKYMAVYLKNEDLFANKFINDEKNSLKFEKAFIDSLRKYYNGQVPNVANNINQLLKSSYITNYNFITFNYTSVLDNIVKRCEYNIGNNATLHEPLHIHGDLNGTPIIGVDNVSQFVGMDYELSISGLRTLVKPVFNEQFDAQRAAKAKNVIRNSDILYIYGWSMGDSDLSWREEIKDWLTVSPSHHLFKFTYEYKSLDGYDDDERMDIYDECVEEIISLLDFTETEANNVRGRIHISIGESIFDFPKLNRNAGDSKKELAAAL